jgi:CCDC81-like prokaryotic HU domain 1/CCDC81-like prokaryotic HU domain 2
MTEFYSFLEHLLYEHECVIIPQLGGFVVNAKDFTFNEQEGKIYPKKKYVAFNEKLKTDDRLLSTEWAKNKAISLKEASLEIAELSKRLKSELTSFGTVQLGILGTFTLNQENRISFSPNPDFNADLSVFGLFPVGLGQIPARVEKKPVLIPTITTEDLPEISSTGHQPVKLTKSVYVYALLAFLIGGLGAFFLTAPATNQSQSSLNPIKIEKKVDVAPVKTVAPAVVDTLPVKTIEAPVIAPVNTPEIKDEDVIYLVAASFQSLKQAEKGLKEFKSRGFDQAEIILKNEQTKFYRISLGTEHSMDAGYAKASELKEKKKVDIWVYKAL